MRRFAAPALAALLLAVAPLSAQSVPPHPEAGRGLVLVKGKRPAEVDEPARVHAAPDGRLLLLDRGKDDVLEFDANRVWTGNLSTRLGGDRFDDPVRAVVDSKGRIHVAEAGTGTIWTLAGGTVVRRIGGRGKEPGRFQRLADLAVDLDDHLYAVDSRGASIQVFTPDGLLAGAITGFGGIPFREPVLVAVDPGRRVVVYDRGLDAVVAGDPDGSAAWSFPIADRFHDRDDLADLAVDAAGRVYLLDRDSGRVLVLARDGTPLGTLFGHGPPPDGFRKPVGIAVDAAGTLLVLDEEDRRVQEFTVPIPDRVAPRPRLYRGTGGEGRAWRPVARTAAGGRERWLAWDGAGYSVREADGRSLGRVAVEPPKDGPVAAGGPEGFVLVDRGDRLLRVGPDGAPLGEIPRRTAGGELKRPRAVAIRGDGVLAVYDADDDDLLLLGPDGAYRQRVGRPGRGPGEIEDALAVAFDASGGLLVLDRDGARIQRFDAFGAFLDAAPLGSAGPRKDRPFADLAADPFGGLWVAIPEAGLVTRFDDRLRFVCSVGDPRRVLRPVGIVAGGDGRAWIRGEDPDGQAVPLACDGPPPRPRPPTLALEGDPPAVVLRWDPGLPGAAAWSVRREEPAGWREIARVDGDAWTMPPEAYAGSPARLAIAGVDVEGRAGEPSEPVEDVLSPALVALREGRTADAERWLSAAFEAARSGGDPASLPALAAARARAAAAAGDFDRALAIVDSTASLPGADPTTARAAVYRRAVRAALDAGDGPGALAWLDRMARISPDRLSPVEERARDLAAAGDSDAAARLLVGLRDVADPGAARIDRAVAEIRLAQGRYREAVEEMTGAWRAAGDPAEREELDRGLAILAEDAIDRIVEERAGEEAVRSVLAVLEEHAAALPEEDRDRWEMRIAALAVKPRIRAALDLATSDFAAAREMLEQTLAEAGSLFVDDEIRARAALGELALAAGEREAAREQFLKILEIRPDWVPDPEEFSPTVRAFVDSVRSGGGSP